MLTLYGVPIVVWTVGYSSYIEAGCLKLTSAKQDYTQESCFLFCSMFFIDHSL